MAPDKFKQILYSLANQKSSVIWTLANSSRLGQILSGVEGRVLEGLVGVVCEGKQFVLYPQEKIEAQMEQILHCLARQWK